MRTRPGGPTGPTVHRAGLKAC